MEFLALGPVIPAVILILTEAMTNMEIIQSTQTYQKISNFEAPMNKQKILKARPL